MVRTVLTDSVVTSRRVGAVAITEIEYQTINQMDLKTARLQAIAASKKERKKTFYLNVDPEGEIEVSNDFDKDGSLVCYRNGSEVALPEPTNAEPKTKTKSTTTKPGEPETIMAKKKEVKKAAKKVAKKSTGKSNSLYGPSVTGAGQELTVKKIREALKAGKTVRKANNGFYLSIKFLEKADAEKKIAVHVK